MEFFLFILFVLLVSILILLISARNNLTIRLTDLHRKIDDLSDQLRKIKLKEDTDVKVSEEKSLPIEKPVAHKTPPVLTLQEREKAKVEEIKKELERKPVSEENFPAITPPSVQQVKPVATQSTPKPTKPGFFERNPDLEKFIGENLANKIGIGILVLGIGFFVKYAIDKDWINEIGRVFIGILCGGILLGVAHYMRKSFAAFSSVLVGGGIAVLYLTIAIAFHEYKLFSQAAAFILMVVITGFTILLSIGYNRIELAVLAILGGFGAPFMVSTGEGNYVVLFTYILILDVGMLVLAYFKKWNLINIITYVFTVLLFGSWLALEFDGEKIGMISGALTFSTLFYLVFFAMNIVWNAKQKVPFKAIEFTLLLSNTFLYYAAGMIALDNSHGEGFKGLFTTLLGVFNFVFAFLLYRNKQIDRNLVFLLIGLVLTFLSLAAPVQLEGNYITLFWAAETVLLLWLSQKSGIKLMKLASVVIMALMVISLVMDWEQLYVPSNELNIIFNKAYITSIAGIISIILTLYFLKNESVEYARSLEVYKPLLSIAGILILYTSQFLELQHQLNQFDFDAPAIHIIMGAYNMLFILALLLAKDKLNLPEGVKTAFAFWGFIAMASFLFYYHYEFIFARDQYLDGVVSFTAFAFHYLYVILVIIISIVTLRQIQTFKEFNASTYNAYSWIYVFFFVTLASAELDHTVVLIAFSGMDSIDHILTQNHKIGFPILWGLAAFILIAAGLKWRKKHLRIISLCLLLITLLKLFFIDIRGISEGGKIAAFISLGVLLLVVSFMYQRLKKILLADEPVIREIDKENPA